LSIFHTHDDSNSIIKGISSAKVFKLKGTNPKSDFGQGNSDKIFLELLRGDKIWSIECQKQFQDINYE